MASFPYSSFQVIFGRSDPRTALIFSHPFEAIYPHIVTMGRELRCEVVRYPPSQHLAGAGGEGGVGDDRSGDGQLLNDQVNGHGSGDTVVDGLANRGSVATTDAFYQQQHQQHRSFAEVFEEAFNEGKWLVVDSISRVEHMSWRHVGSKLAVTVPSAKHHLRKHFRLFTFLTVGQDVHVYVPPIMLQFALVVDTAGMVHAKSTVGPLFETDTMIDDINQVLSSRALLAGANGNGSGGANGGDGSPSDSLGGGGAGGGKKKKPTKDGTNRNNPYATVTHARLLSKSNDDYEYDGEGDDKPGAMTEAYIDEVLAAIREELLADQEELIGAVDKATTLRVSELDRRLATRMGIMGEVAEADAKGEAALKGGGVGHHTNTYDADRARTQIIEEEMVKANDNYEWIYPALSRWVTMQHPTLDAKAIQTIADDGIVRDKLVWQTATETCHSGIWNGSDVLIKGPVLGYSTDKNFAYQQASHTEAMLHSNQRHPHVHAVYGVLTSDKCTMVMEEAIGTVEQAFMRARETNTHWRVRDYLKLAQHVLRGMQYLSTRVTHRDISARSIVELSGQTFKISQFQCAYPLGAQAPESRALVPIRWCAPEALCGRFNAKSDMWSFGIMMWECLHYCCELPYSKFPQAADAILEGKVNECRTAAAKYLYELLCEPCFEYEIAHRPMASDLLLVVDRLLFNQDPHSLDRRIPMPGDADQKDPYPNPTPP